MSSSSFWRWPAIGLLSLAGAAHAREVEFGPHDVPTAFFISKSDDPNRVDYGIHLDDKCAPVGDSAMFLYWRVFDHGPPSSTHNLSLIEYVPYGISFQRMLKRTSNGGEYAVKLKQIDRVILITTSRDAGGSCVATSQASINGRDAQFVSAYAKLKGVMSVEYVDLFGKNLKTGEQIIERVKP